MKRTDGAPPAPTHGIQAFRTPEMVTTKIPVDTTRFSSGDAVLSAVGATLLIVTELLGAVFAFAWAVGGLLGLGETVTYGLMAVLAIPGLYASLMLTRRILKVEKTLRTNPPSAV